MKNDDYWFPWYPAHFKRKTEHLTALQDGIYRRLIDYYMENKSGLPDSDPALARIAGVGVQEFVDNAGIIRAFFKAGKEGRLTHTKCEELLKAQRRMSKSYAERGSKGGKKKAENNQLNLGLESNSLATAKQEPQLNQAQYSTVQDSRVQEKNSDSSKPINKNSSSERGSFSIEKFLRDEDRDDVRRSASGWDIYWLMREFDSRVNGGSFETPKKPAAAFKAWVKSFTKDKAP